MNSDIVDGRETIDVSAANTTRKTASVPVRARFGQTQFLSILAAAALSALLTACGGAGSQAETVTETVTASASTVTVTAAAPSPTTTPPPAGPAQSFGDGTYQAGTDVAAGTYSTAGPRDTACAYTYLPRKGAQLTEADGGRTFIGPGYMELANRQIVQALGCKTWQLYG